MNAITWLLLGWWGGGEVGVVPIRATVAATDSFVSGLVSRDTYVAGAEKKQVVK